MLDSAYGAVMNPNRNPLSKLHRMVTFQIMTVLAWMWSSVFSFWLGSLAVFGPSVAVHMILLIGVFFTAEVFALARRPKR